MDFSRLFFRDFSCDICPPHADGSFAHFPHRCAIAAEHVLEDGELRISFPAERGGEETSAREAEAR